MNLNLGLESLNRVNSAVVPFTPASAIEMQNASEAITNLMASLENYYDAARNAMLVKKAIRKYGKTQSIVALIGQEGLAAAQSFSMEGFWQKTKEFLIKIWEKIKEWWGRFWGMFFSVENKLSSFVSNIKGSSKRLAHDVEFEGPDMRGINEYMTQIRLSVTTIKNVLNNPDDSNLQSKIQQLVNTSTGGHNEAGAVTSGKYSVNQMQYRFTRREEVATYAGSVLDCIKEFKQHKKDIDEYTKKAIEKVGKMKITDGGSAGNAFGMGARAASTDRDATSEEQDTATKVLKNCAKVNNQMIASTIKQLTTVAVKIMAHTRLIE
jgi:hypothetical protein